MSHTIKHRKVQVTVVSRPTHVGNDQDHHYEGHLDSLIGINAEALLHHDPHPDAGMVLIPAMQAIAEMLSANNLLGAVYWRGVWHRQVSKDDNDHHNYLALPATCCLVTDEPIPV